jgi:hypothetical protein
MNYSIIQMLEAMKQGVFTNVDEYLSEDDKRNIVNWFSKYTCKNSNKMKLESIIELLYELYIHENIDLYPVEEFQRVAAAWAEIYHFEKDLFLNMLQAFRILIYGEI